MTQDERLDRIEHITAGLVEERRKDRDEYKALWRETQRQIESNARAIAQVTDLVRENAREVSELRIHLRDLAERTDSKIDKLVSAMGEFIARQERRDV